MNYKKKVLIITNNLYGGGAEKVLENLVNYLDKSKYNITLYTLHKTPIEDGIYKNIQVKYFFLNKSFYAKVYNKIFLKIYDKVPKLFYKYFIREKFDVEIAFIEGYATKIVASSSNNQSKKYAWVHVDLINTPWTEVAYRSKKEEEQCYNKFHKILCVSKDVKDKFCKKYNVQSDVDVQYNPIDEKVILSKSRKKVLMDKNKNMQFVTVGRLEHQKGYERLLKIVKKLKNEEYDFNILIIGKGTLERKLKEYVKRYNLMDYISFLGYLDNPYPYIKNSSAFICSSFSEGYSTAVVESIILGLPILTTKCSGMKEIFGNTNCGIICNNDDASLYNMIKNVLDYPEQLNNIKKNLIERQNYFSLKNRIKEIEELLDGISN